MRELNVGGVAKNEHYDKMVSYEMLVETRVAYASGALTIKISLKILWFTLIGFLISITNASADNQSTTVTVAVASNFLPTMKLIALAYEKHTKNNVVLSAGSTGKHYAQILNGAPYDVFFAADVQRPKKLEDQGFGIRGSRSTYAVGALVVWSTHIDTVNEEQLLPLPTVFRTNIQQLLSGQSNYTIALANPKLAPYGKAAQEVLAALELSEDTIFKMVRGENISQTLQFVLSGATDLGFIALSQVRFSSNKDINQHYWIVPQSLYTPIEQQVIQLRQSIATDQFMRFIKKPSIQKLIENSGYHTQGTASVG